MRLIDADALAGIFNKDSIIGCILCMVIDSQPTAFDVDKVLGQLEEAKFPITDLKAGIKINGIQQTDDAVLYEKSLEIVKSGLKQESE